MELLGLHNTSYQSSRPSDRLISHARPPGHPANQVPPGPFLMDVNGHSIVPHIFHLFRQKVL